MNSKTYTELRKKYYLPENPSLALLNFLEAREKVGKKCDEFIWLPTMETLKEQIEGHPEKRQDETWEDILSNLNKIDGCYLQNKEKRKMSKREDSSMALEDNQDSKDAKDMLKAFDDDFDIDRYDTEDLKLDEDLMEILAAEDASPDTFEKVTKIAAEDLRTFERGFQYASNFVFRVLFYYVQVISKGEKILGLKTTPNISYLHGLHLIIDPRDQLRLKFSPISQELRYSGLNETLSKQVKMALDLSRSTYGSTYAEQMVVNMIPVFDRETNYTHDSFSSNMKDLLLISHKVAMFKKHISGTLARYENRQEEIQSLSSFIAKRSQLINSNPEMERIVDKLEEGRDFIENLPRLPVHLITRGIGKLLGEDKNFFVQDAVYKEAIFPSTEIFDASVNMIKLAIKEKKLNEQLAKIIIRSVSSGNRSDYASRYFTTKTKSLKFCQTYWGKRQGKLVNDARLSLYDQELMNSTIENITGMVNANSFKPFDMSRKISHSKDQKYSLVTDYELAKDDMEDAIFKVARDAEEKLRISKIKTQLIANNEQVKEELKNQDGTTKKPGKESVASENYTVQKKTVLKDNLAPLSSEPQTEKVSKRIDMEDENLESPTKIEILREKTVTLLSITNASISSKIEKITVRKRNSFFKIILDQKQEYETLVQNFESLIDYFLKPKMINLNHLKIVFNLGSRYIIAKSLFESRMFPLRYSDFDTLNQKYLPNSNICTQIMEADSLGQNIAYYCFLRMLQNILNSMEVVVNQSSMTEKTMIVSETARKLIKAADSVSNLIHIFMNMTLFVPGQSSQPLVLQCFLLIEQQTQSLFKTLEEQNGDKCLDIIAGYLDQLCIEMSNGRFLYSPYVVHGFSICCREMLDKKEVGNYGLYKKVPTFKEDFNFKLDFGVKKEGGNMKPFLSRDQDDFLFDNQQGMQNEIEKNVWTLNLEQMEFAHNFLLHSDNSLHFPMIDWDKYLN